MESGLLLILALYAIAMVLPFKWAADFTGGTNTGIVPAFIASVLAPVVAVLAFRGLSGGFNGFLVAYLAMLGTYIGILRVPPGSWIGFGIIALLLQVVAGFVLMSTGMTIGKLMGAVA